MKLLLYLLVMFLFVLEINFFYCSGGKNIFYILLGLLAGYTSGYLMVEKLFKDTHVTDLEDADLRQMIRFLLIYVPTVLLYLCINFIFSLIINRK